MKKMENVLWGIVLVVVGLILGSNALGFTNIDIFFDGWWTLFIIVPCFVGLFKEHEKTGNLIGLLIGVVLLLCCLDVLSFSMIWKLMFPAILVIVGVSIIFKDTFNRKISAEIKRINASRGTVSEYCATFSGQNINYDGQEFWGADLTAVFGGVKCDLNNAIFREDQVINCTSVFGGIDIYVPDFINVKIKSTSIFGGISDHKQHNVDPNAKVLYVNATCLFGGVDIK